MSSSIKATIQTEQLANGFSESKSIKKSADLIDFDSILTIDPPEDASSVQLTNNHGNGSDTISTETSLANVAESSDDKSQCNGIQSTDLSIEDCLNLNNGDISEKAIADKIDVPELNYEFPDTVDGASNESTIDLDGIFDSLSAAPKTVIQNEISACPISESSAEPDTLINDIQSVETNSSVITEIAEVAIPDQNEEKSISCDATDDLVAEESKEENIDISESILLKEQDIDLDESAQNESLATTSNDEKVTSVAEIDENCEEMVVDTEATVDDQPKQSEPELSLFDQLKTTETPEPMETSAHNDATETENKSDDKNMETIASGSNTSDENDLIENHECKENNLLEVMADSPHSMVPSCEGSMSSFRDDNDSTMNDFGASSTDLKEDNSINTQTELNEKRVDGNAENTSIDIEIQDESTKESNQNQSNQVELPELNDEQMDVVAADESKDEEKIESAKPDATIELDDDDDVLITSNAPAPDDAKIQATEEIPTENLATEDSLIEDEPPAKRIRLESTENESKNDNEKEKEETQEITTISEENSMVNDDDDIVLIDSSDQKPESSKENEPISSPTKQIDIEDESLKRLQTSEGLEITKVMKTEEKSETKKETNDKMDTETVDEDAKPVEIELTPKPEEVEKRSIPMDFMMKFKTEFTRMTRKDLEELVLTKVVEAIVHKSEYGYLKEKVESQEQIIQSFRTKVQELNKQYRDLEMVYARLKKDLENKNQSIVTPIKITRAVGLQVCLQKSSDKNATQNAATQKKIVSKPAMASPNQLIIRPSPQTAQQKQKPVLIQQATTPRQQILKQQQAIRAQQEQQRQMAEQNRQAIQKRSASVLQVAQRKILPVQG